MGDAYVHFLGLHEAGVICYDPQLVRVDRNSPWVLQAVVDEVHHHPAPVLSLDDLWYVSMLHHGIDRKRNTYLVVRVGWNTMTIANSTSGLSDTAMRIDGLAINVVDVRGLAMDTTLAWRIQSETAWLMFGAITYH